MKIKNNLFFLFLLTELILSIFTDWYGPLCLILFFALIIAMLDKLGKGIVLPGIIALHSCFVCLLVPLVGYTYFSSSNHLAKLWGRSMPIASDKYFSFALPAMICFLVGLFMPSRNKENNDYGVFLNNTLVRAKATLQYKPFTGVYLLVIGTLMLWVTDYAPSAFRFVSILFFFSSFAGFLYVYYTKTLKFRKIVLFGFSIFILLSALNSGMFTVVAYMGLTLFSFFFAGQKTHFWKKLLWSLLGIFMLLLIQMVKPEYRRITWKEDYQGSRVSLFGGLIVDKIFNIDLASMDVFFPIYYRTNQGFNVALVMRRFPEKTPYDNGTNILNAIGSSFVPRLLWPDKPEAGGKFNMQYYTGIYLNGWSTNVGPLGEAYGSFGPFGGAIFMFFLGFFIRSFYRRIFGLARKTPLLLFWLPVLFYQVTYSAETDTLQILNSLLKSGFFVYLLYRLIPHWFKMEKKGAGEEKKNAARLLPGHT
jgi:hypothetical protein